MSKYQFKSESMVRFGKGHRNFNVAKDARTDTVVRPYRNVCPTCHGQGPGRQCVETYYSCVSCQGWW